MALKLRHLFRPREFFPRRGERAVEAFGLEALAWVVIVAAVVGMLALGHCWHPHGEGRSARELSGVAWVAVRTPPIGAHQGGYYPLISAWSIFEFNKLTVRINRGAPGEP